MSAGRIRKCPPRSSSSNAPNTLGESNRGQQNQSIDPSVVTRAAVWRSPINAWSAMAVSNPARVVGSVVGAALVVMPDRDLGRRRVASSPVGDEPPLDAAHAGSARAVALAPPHAQEDRTMRRLATGLLILLSSLCLFLSSTSLWVRHNVINTGVFVSNVETIVDLPQVRSRVTTQVTATVMTNPRVTDAID